MDVDVCAGVQDIVLGEGIPLVPDDAMDDPASHVQRRLASVPQNKTRIGIVVDKLVDGNSFDWNF